MTLLERGNTCAITRHAHDDIEIHYVFSGALTYEISGRLTTVPGGCFIIIPARLHHRGLGNVGTRAARLGIHFASPSRQSASLTTFTFDELKEIFDVFQNHGRCTMLKCADTNKIAKELSHYPAETSHDPILFRNLVCALVYATFLATQKPAAAREQTNIVLRLKDYISSNCCQKITASDIVRVSGYSRARLFSLFASQVGMTPNDYLRRCRVEKAKSLLKQQLPIATIARQCGFSSVGYFKTVYREYTGHAPRQKTSLPHPNKSA